MVGELPQDFLRVGAPYNPAVQQQQQQQIVYAAPQPVTRLSITVCQAKLNKNYGLTKMDLYCRVRVGHTVLETNTSHSGGKTPVWNKVIHAPLQPGVDSIYLEIFDERSFTVDDRVAWVHIPLPSEVLTGGETSDKWYPLNGKLGDEREGTINLVLSLTKVQPTPLYNQSVMYTMPQGGVYAPAAQPLLVVQGGHAPYMYSNTIVTGGTYVPVHPGPYPQPMVLQQGPMVPQQGQVPQAGPPVPQGPAFSEADVVALLEMFPNIDQEVVRSVLEANRGNKEASINNLLAMDAV